MTYQKGKLKTSVYWMKYKINQTEYATCQSNLENIFREVRRVLKKGGYVTAIIQRPPFYQTPRILTKTAKA